jgi:predicted nucleic acid-binding protein
VTGSLLDTSVVIAAATPGSLPAAAAISVVTVGELRAGVLLATETRLRELRKRRFDAVRAAFAPIPVDEAVAERYGDLLAFARSHRRTAKASDLLIVATAAASKRTLYTLDKKQADLARATEVAVAEG